MAHKTVRSASIHSPTIRGAYFYLHEKRTTDAEKKPIPVDQQKHEFVGLIPKLNADATKCANYTLFANLAMPLVAQVPEWGGQWPAGGNWPIKDGDQKAAQLDQHGKSKYPWMAGHWVINFSSNYPPKIAVLQNGAVTEIPARRMPGAMANAYKSGDFCVVSTYAFSYDNKSKGVKYDIEGVLFVGAGEAIGTAQRSAAQIFEGVSAAPAGLPMPGAGAPQPGPTVYAPAPGAPPMPPVNQAPPSYTTVTAPPPAAPGAPPLPPFPAAAGAPPMPPVPGR